MREVHGEPKVRHLARRVDVAHEQILGLDVPVRDAPGVEVRHRGRDGLDDLPARLSLRERPAALVHQREHVAAPRVLVQQVDVSALILEGPVEWNHGGVRQFGVDAHLALDLRQREGIQPVPQVTLQREFHARALVHRVVHRAEPARAHPLAHTKIGERPRASQRPRRGEGAEVRLRRRAAGEGRGSLGLGHRRLRTLPVMPRLGREPEREPPNLRVRAPHKKPLFCRFVAAARPRVDRQHVALDARDGVVALRLRIFVANPAHPYLRLHASLIGLVHGRRHRRAPPSLARSCDDGPQPCGQKKT